MDFDSFYAQLRGGGITEQDKSEAQRRAIMAASLGLLAAAPSAGRGWGGAAHAVGRGGLLGMGSYYNALDEAAQAKKGNLGEMAQAMQLYQAKRGMDEDEQARGVLSNFQMPAPLPSMSPTNANAAALAQAPKAGVYEKLLAQADALEGKGLVKQAQQYRTMAEKYAPQYGDVETVMQDGKPVLLQKFKNRAPEALQGFQPKPELALQDLGGQVAAIDKLATAPGTMFNKTMDPAQIDASKRGWASHGLERERFGYQQQRDKEAGPLNMLGLKAGELVAGLRKEYNALEPVKNYAAALPVLSSAKGAPDTPAGDIDLIYAVGKVLDPNSVVREGELNLVIKSGSPLQKFQGYVNYIARGRGRLPPSQRKELLEMLDGRVGQLKAQRDQAAAPYVQQAQTMGLPMDQIFADGPAKQAEQPRIVDFNNLPAR